MRPNNPVHRCKPESPTRELGREKGFKATLQSLVRHACAMILDLEYDVLSWLTRLRGGDTIDQI